jgi:hypothetical protein
MFHHRADHGVVVFSLIVSAGKFLIDHASQPIFGELAPGGRIRDRTVAHRPDVLDGVNACVGGANDIPTVGGYRHAQPMGLIDGDFEQVQGKKLIDLENLTAEFLFASHRFAHFIWRRDDDVITDGSRAEGIVAGADAADRPARHPNPRPANFAQLGTLFLRPGPRAVLIDLDIGAGGDAQMEIKLSMEIFQVAVPIDEARQDGLTFDFDDLSAGGNRDGIAPPDCLESASLDNNGTIFNRRPASAIDQSATLHHECLLCHVLFLLPMI